MSYEIEILAIKNELYKSIGLACNSLNKVQKNEEFNFKLPPERLRDSIFLQRRENYQSEEVFEWLKEYRKKAGGNRPYIILVVDGILSSRRLTNLFGNVSANDGLAVFTIKDFDQFVNDIVRFCRYYFVRYAISFLQPSIQSHDDPTRKNCIFHKKINKLELRDSLNTGNICPNCRDQLRPMLNPEISDSIEKMLLLVSNQHPYSIVIKGGGVKGLAFAGALLELEPYFSFDTFAGTSAGAIAAVLLGAGYKPSELLEILRNKDFNDFKDASVFKGILNFLLTRGFYPGDEIENWINSLLKMKFPEKLNDIALEEFPTHTIIYSSRIKDGTLIFDSKRQRKETHAAYAARCSMSIPYFFSPKLVDGIRVYDGGARNNFPLRLFIESYPNRPVIGLYLISGTKKGGLVIGEMANIAMDGEEIPIVEENLDKVVIIDPRPIKTTDFNLNEKKKELLILAGRLGALKFIDRNYKDIQIDRDKIIMLTERIDGLRKAI
jgi:predicted acylesterase/phospholipase RssA